MTRMNGLKQQIKKMVSFLFCRGVTASIILLVLSLSLLTYLFSVDEKESPLSYFAYLFSAYALTINLVWILQKIKKQLDRNPFFHKYMNEMDFKAEMSLYLSFGVNLFYSVYKAFAGFYYHSIWFGTVAFYYIILSAQRFLLLKHLRSRERDPLEEYKRYAFCGYLLLVLTIALIGMSVHMIQDGRVATYPGHIIYAAAGYTFYNFITAIMNLIRYRRWNNPIYSASKIIAFVTALVSVFSLQTTMFAVFGDQAAQQQQMNLLTGAVVFTLVLAMAIFMVIHGRRSMKRIRQKH